jgi:N12 class adenine-specific DNA methylase
MVAGKTISMHASEETARRMEYVARVEDRTPSQIAAAALKFYLQLPPEAHAALRQVQALGTDRDVEQISRKMARLLLDAQFEVAERRVVASMTTQGLGGLQSEDDILAEANALTSRSRAGAIEPQTDTGSSARAGRTA